jgi:hypothetical protein
MKSRNAFLRMNGHVSLFLSGKSMLFSAGHSRFDTFMFKYQNLAAVIHALRLFLSEILNTHTDLSYK